MNYLLKIDEIIEILIRNNEIEVAKEIKELKTSASTSSELLMMVVYSLKQLIENNEKINELIKKDVLELIKFCESIGLYIK